MIEEYTSNPLKSSNNCLDSAIKLVLSETAVLMGEVTGLFCFLSLEADDCAEYCFLNSCNIAMCNKLLKISKWLLSAEEYLQGITVHVPETSFSNFSLAPVFISEHELPGELKQLLIKTDRLSGRVEHLSALFRQYFYDGHDQTLNQKLIAQCSMLSEFIYEPKELWQK